MRTILLRSLVHGSLLVASVLVALVVCEISLRILNVSYPVFDDYDATRGFRLRPGKQGWYRAEGEAYLSINSLGYRDREHDRAKPENTFRVAVLGQTRLPKRDRFLSSRRFGIVSAIIWPPVTSQVVKR